MNRSPAKDPSSASPWYVAAFGEHYQDLYHHRNERDARMAIDFLQARADLDLSVGLVLDLCCGSGRHSLEWIRRLSAPGMANIIGLDLSANLLNDAAAAARAAGVRLPLVRGDMRHLPFASGSFRLVLNLFTSFGYFEDEEENAGVFREVARVLESGRGRFVFDHINPAFLRKNLVANSTRTTPAGIAVRESRSLDLGGRRVTKRIEFEARGRSHTLVERVRLYEPEEVQAMGAQAGLRLEAAHGGFDESPLAPGSSRAVYVFHC